MKRYVQDLDIGDQISISGFMIGDEPRPSRVIDRRDTGGLLLLMSFQDLADPGTVTTFRVSRLAPLDGTSVALGSSTPGPPG